MGRLTLLRKSKRKAKLKNECSLDYLPLLIARAQVALKLYLYSASAGRATDEDSNEDLT